MSSMIRVIAGMLIDAVMITLLEVRHLHRHTVCLHLCKCHHHRRLHRVEIAIEIQDQADREIGTEMTDTVHMATRRPPILTLIRLTLTIPCRLLPRLVIVMMRLAMVFLLGVKKEAEAIAIMKVVIVLGRDEIPLPVRHVGTLQIHHEVERGLPMERLASSSKSMVRVLMVHYANLLMIQERDIITLIEQYFFFFIFFYTCTLKYYYFL